MTFEAGARLGPYEIQAPLGSGGMGMVYRAYDTRLERLVALKLVGPSLAADANARTRLLREARAASALNHPNICTIYEVGEAAGQSYIAMEYVEGRPLKALIPRDGLALETALLYASQIAGALAHAHERGVVHRDLKTANIVITSDGRAKVLDFGLALRLRGDQVAEATQSQDSLSGNDAFSGTLQYLAPEVLRGEPPDARSDLWAFGVVLFEMAAGQAPFRGNTTFELSSAILREPPAPVPSRIPAALRSIILRCLSKEPAHRHQRAGEVRAALELAAEIAFSGETPPAARHRAPESSERLTFGGQPSTIPEANEYFEKAILFLPIHFDLQRARQMLERALELDPEFVEARAWYALTHALMVITGYSNDESWLYRAEDESLRILSVDPQSWRAHATMAGVFLWQGRKDLVPGEVAKALAVNPQNPEALLWLVQYHSLSGDSVKAQAFGAQVVEQFPTFFPLRMVLGEILRERGDWAGAIAMQEKLLEQDPQNIFALSYLARVHLDAGDLAKARQSLQRTRPEDRENYLLRLHWVLLLLLEGNRDEAVKEMDEGLIRYGKLATPFAYMLAEAYVLLDERQKALEYLREAVRAGDEREEWLARDPLLASLRDDRRFQQILESIVFRRRLRAQSQSNAASD